MRTGEVLGSAIDALTRSDAEALERLGESIPDAPATDAERREAEQQLRALGGLMALTRRNLRLLRGDFGAASGYGGRGS